MAKKSLTARQETRPEIHGLGRIHLIRCFLVVIALFELRVAMAQTEHVLENQVSICVDPSIPSRVARSQAEQRQMTGCVTWSSFAGTPAVFTALQFRGCGPKALPLFLKAILQAWSRLTPIQNPVTQTIFDSPEKFQLRPVRDGESRVDSLLVWKGMAALVVSEDTSASAMTDLQRVKVLYPSGSKCGELAVTGADKLATSLQNPSDYKFLIARQPRLFWNQWVEKADNHSETQIDVLTSQRYQYQISFSALNFEGFRRGDSEARELLSAQQLENYLPPLDRYKISVLPIGDFGTRGGYVRNVVINDGVLRATLTQPDLGKATSYTEMAAKYDALYVVDDNNHFDGRFSFEFEVTNSSCAALAVIVWSETRQTIVTSWIRPLRATTEGEPITANTCGLPGPVSRRVGVAAMPQFDTAADDTVAARISFVDFGSYAIGSFQDMRYRTEPPIVWVLQTSNLRGRLAELGASVNRTISSGDFDMHDSSDGLARVLFSCHDLKDADCTGAEALRRLRDLATTPGARVQAAFRDIANNGTYYLPIHLLEQSQGNLLGRNIRFIQPLPLAWRPNARTDDCVREWSGALIVRDVASFNDGNWRSGWLTSFATPQYRIFKSVNDLVTLRDDYFGDPDLVSENPEGLVLLAHHGNGDIADAQDLDPIKQITPDDIKRKFRSGSIVLLVACSVGALGDIETGSSRLLFRLNEKNMRAAIISPFEVPARLAKRFLDHFNAAAGELTQDASLYELLENTKNRLRNSTDKLDDSLMLKSAVDVFMVVGDGDTKVCKRGESR